MNDVIAALSSAPVSQAISIIRITGDNCFNLINTIFSKNIINQKGNTTVVGYIQDPLTAKKIDKVVLVLYRTPKSFTGEDLIEINCHGGILITQKILKVIFTLGIRQADPGEFSRRAFLNGKITLLEAEAINDLINAKNNHIVNASLSILQGNNKNELKELQNEIIDLISKIEVNIDYPEYDGVEITTIEKTIPLIINFYEKIKKIKKNSLITKLLKNGVDTIIIGKPNVGKSSFLNALLQEELAIVSELAGTTRDLVKASLNLGNITLNLIDTAGIRESNDFIEVQGINKAKNLINKADLIIIVLDGSKALDKDDESILKLLKNKNYIVILNKKDLGIKINIENSVAISAVNNDLNGLINVIENKIITSKINFEYEILLTNANQLALLDKIEMNIKRVIEDLESGVHLDLVLIYLQKVWDNFNELMGEKFKKNLLDEIFSKFCLGK